MRLIGIQHYVHSLLLRTAHAAVQLPDRQPTEAFASLSVFELWRTFLDERLYALCSVLCCLENHRQI